MGIQFVYEHGSFVAGDFLDDPADSVGDRQGDDADLLKKHGFSRSQSFGDGCGVGFVLHEHDDAHKDATVFKWVVEFTTACLYCLVGVSTWPDLIELLAKLSPIVTAGFLDEENIGVVQDVLRDYRRMHPKR